MEAEDECVCVYKETKFQGTLSSPLRKIMNTQTRENKDQNESYLDCKTLVAQKYRKKLSETL